ncbi:MAG: DUF5076 domain-containing protein [Chthoniobacteraceae bacterium]
MIRELIRPVEIAGDENATEMIRMWLAHNALHVSLLVGMWNDAEDCKIDERDAWGELLSDLTKHIANAMMQSNGWDYDATRNRIKDAFLANYDDKSKNIEGTHL